MAGKPQNIKVRVDRLIEHIEHKRDELRERYAIALEEFERLDAIWKGGVMESAQAVVDRLSRDEWPEPTSYGSESITISSGRSRPTLPKPPDDKIDSDLNLLRLASDETITINTESDWVKYL